MALENDSRLNKLDKLISSAKKILGEETFYEAVLEQFGQPWGEWMALRAGALRSSQDGEGDEEMDRFLEANALLITTLTREISNAVNQLEQELVQ